MKKQFYFFLLFVLVIHYSANAQMEIDGESLFGNEWINFDQSYFKIIVDTDGVYKISSSDLEAGGVDLNEFSGSELQLFNLGKEIPIQVSTSESFGQGDFIVFEGKRNGGELDRQLYYRSGEIIADSLQLNPKYSLFSDKSAYFLTWSPGQHLRIVENPNDNSNSPIAETFYIHEDTNIYNEFFFKKTYNGSDKVRISDYDLCEGFGSFLLDNQVIKFSSSNQKDNTGIDPTISLRYGANGTEHDLELSLAGTVLHKESFDDYAVKELKVNFDSELLSSNLSFRLKGLLPSDRYSVAYATLTYPRKLDFSNTLQLHFNSRAGAERKFYQLDDFTSSSDDLYYYDFSENSVKTIELQK